MKEYKLYINGEFRSSSNNQVAESINPADGSVFAKFHLASKEDIELAIDSAYKAQKAWAKTTPREKEALLLRAADIFDRRAAEIREILMRESGSTVAKCNFEIGVVSDILRVAAGEARRVGGYTFVSNDENVFSYAIRQPLGVVAGISPFNAPMILSSKKFAFALAAGNTFVLKPSTNAAVCGLIFGEIFEEAGLPKGVLNIIPCSSSVLGDTFQEDKRIAKITFTGSTKVGAHIAQSAAKYMKKCTFELGGKSPVLALEDADVKYAVDTAFFGIFMHQGQICMAGSRVIVHEKIYDEFCEMFAKKVDSLQVGDPSDPKTVIGPLISGTQCGFIDGLVSDAKSKGARVLTGFRHEGNFYWPTTVADVTPDMDLFKTEAFGPVVAISKARDLDHAIELANNNDYGLSATVITQNIESYLKCAEELETGMLHVNGPSLQDEAHIPFGGVKMSGLGREGGKFSIEEMTELKWVTVEGMGNHKYPF
ncbi:MAG: aldehyde dehydrogenase family protein [Campylobacteraceae bacterium]|nr:aldehyde dehydrogenase family protein [Campylobacteraceae bacterium]